MVNLKKINESSTFLLMFIIGKIIRSKLDVFLKTHVLLLFSSS